MTQEAPARTKIPTTGARRGRTVLRRAGEGRPHGTGQGPGERARTRGHPGRRPGDRAGVRDHGVPGPRGAGPLEGGLVRERRAAAVRGGVRGEAGRQAGEGHRAAGSRRAQHEAPVARASRRSRTTARLTRVLLAFTDPARLSTPATKFHENRNYLRCQDQAGSRENCQVLGLYRPQGLTGTLRLFISFSGLPDPRLLDGVSSKP